MRSMSFLLAVTTCGCAIVADGTPDNFDADTADAFSCIKPFTPRAPTILTGVACSAVATTKSTFAAPEVAWSLLVGSWSLCAPSSSFPAHGFVIGGDQSFRFLDRKGDALVPSEGAGSVKLVRLGARYRLDIERPAGTLSFPIAFVGVDRLDLGEIRTTRMAPTEAVAPLDFADKGRCSLEGRWDVRGSTFVFNGHGSFQGGSNVCDPKVRGTYSLIDDSLIIVGSDGMECPSALAAGWSVTFSEDCQTARLKKKWDECGTRSSELESVLVKR